MEVEFLSRLNHHDGMMHNGRSAGTNLRTLDPAVFLEAGIDREVLIGNAFGCLGRDFERSRHRNDYVRLADAPAFGEGARRRQIPVLAVRRAVIEPGQERLFVLRRESAIIAEFAIAWISIPGRHSPFGDDFADSVRPRQGILEGQQRHRSDLSRTMALLAVVLQDAADLLGVGDAPILFGLGDAADATAGHLRLGHRYQLARQDFVESLREVAACRFTCPRVADAELIVDTSLVADDAIAVYDDC